MSDEHNHHHTVYNGPTLRGDVGGIHVGGNVTIGDTNIAQGAAVPVTDDQRRLVQDVVVAARADGFGPGTEVHELLGQILEAVRAPAAEPKRVRALLADVAQGADVAGALFGAAQLAMVAFG
jgi:hypothetical protein